MRDFYPVKTVYYFNMYKSDWYLNLNKPFLSPPDSIFLPVWVILYSMIIISLIFYLKDGIDSSKYWGLLFFTLQMLLNLSWSYVFFGMQNIAGALIIISLMWIFILLTIITFFAGSKISAILLIPYFIWVSFAFYLNFSYFVLN